MHSGKFCSLYFGFLNEAQTLVCLLYSRQWDSQGTGATVLDHFLDTDQLGKEFIGKGVLPRVVYTEGRGHGAERGREALVSTVTIGIQQAGGWLQAVAGRKQIGDAQLWNEVIFSRFFLYRDNELRGIVL